jgi:hypothetical protein
VAVAAVQQSACDGGPSTAPGSISWIVAYPTAELIAQQSAEAAQLVHAYFDNARTFLIVKADNIAAAQKAFPKATLTVSFTDYTDDLAPALANGSIPAGVKAKSVACRAATRALRSVSANGRLKG